MVAVCNGAVALGRIVLYLPLTRRNEQYADSLDTLWRWHSLRTLTQSLGWALDLVAGSGGLSGYRA